MPGSFGSDVKIPHACLTVVRNQYRPYIVIAGASLMQNQPVIDGLQPSHMSVM